MIWIEDMLEGLVHASIKRSATTTTCTLSDLMRSPMIEVMWMDYSVGFVTSFIRRQTRWDRVKSRYRSSSIMRLVERLSPPPWLGVTPYRVDEEGDE
jgi:hypothetical protein